MCGRITLTRPNLESVASELNVAPEGCRGYPILEPHYNIASTSVHPILTLNERKRFISPDDLGQYSEERTRPNDQLAVWELPTQGASHPRRHAAALSRMVSTSGAGSR